MADPFVAEIRIFASTFAPTGWALCNGQILPIAQNTALFSLIGTTYGGDGKNNFALPDLQGRAPMQHMQGPGLTERYLGEASGSDKVTLLISEMPAHGHALMASTSPASGRDPTNAPLARSRNGNAYQDVTNQNLVSMNPKTVSQTGASLPHNNMQPYLGLTFIIALQGIFPPRS